MEKHTRLQRRTLGSRFSEGARLAWLAMAKKKWGHADLAAAIGRPQATIHRWLYGDLLPDLLGATLLEKVLGIKCPLWFVAPKSQFVPPAARAA